MSGVSHGRGTTGEDYAEGTFTPALTGATVVGAPTLAGRWTRIGRAIDIEITLNCSLGNTIASTGGTTYVNNLPFTAVGAGGAQVTNATTVATLALGYCSPTTTRLYLGSFAAQTEVTYIHATYTI